MGALNIELLQPSNHDRPTIKNLFVFYRYDLLPYIDSGPGSAINSHGIIDGTRARTHDETLRGLDVWWKKPGVLFPMLLRAGGTPAGFVMIGRPPYANPSADFEIIEFFVANKFRGLGAGSEAVRLVLERFKGRGALRYLPKNTRAARFWRKALDKYAIDVSPITEGNPGFTFRSE